MKILCQKKAYLSTLNSEKVLGIFLVAGKPREDYPYKKNIQIILCCPMKPKKVTLIGYTSLYTKKLPQMLQTIKPCASVLGT